MKTLKQLLRTKGSTIHSIAPDARVFEALERMAENNVGALVVLEGERMAGMLTFREVLHGLNANGGNLADLRVKSLMVADPVCGSPGDSIDQLREVMTKNHVRYLPVREGDKLLGVISFHDVAKSVIKETSFENRLLKRYIKNWPEGDEPAK